MKLRLKLYADDGRKIADTEIPLGDMPLAKALVLFEDLKGIAKPIVVEDAESE